MNHPVADIPAPSTYPEPVETTTAISQDDSLEAAHARTEEQPSVPLGPRRSGRIRKKPDWFGYPKEE